MNFTKEDKVYISRALATEVARLKRALNTSPSMAIKDILGAELQAILVLESRVFNEAVKEVAK